MIKPKITIVMLITAVVLTALPVAAQQLPPPDTVPAETSPITVQPIRHGSVVLEWNDRVIYVDPVQPVETFSGLPAPDLILITDIHGDHFNMDVLNALNTANSTIVVPRAVADRLSESPLLERVVILGNGKRTVQKTIPIRAVPMYNLPESDDSRHPKGRGNGYVVTLGGKKVYLSGDTEGIPEMRALQNIDVAFVCMNLPYTMDVQQAADAVSEFEPAIVYPYHYRGQDTATFRELVKARKPGIEVRLKDWYAGSE